MASVLQIKCRSEVKPQVECDYPCGCPHANCSRQDGWGSLNLRLLWGQTSAAGLGSWGSGRGLPPPALHPSPSSLRPSPLSKPATVVESTFFQRRFPSKSWIGIHFPGPFRRLLSQCRCSTIRSFTKPSRQLIGTSQFVYSYWVILEPCPPGCFPEMTFHQV